MALNIKIGKSVWHREGLIDQLHKLALKTVYDCVEFWYRIEVA